MKWNKMDHTNIWYTIQTHWRSIKMQAKQVRHNIIYKNISHKIHLKHEQVGF